MTTSTIEGLADEMRRTLAATRMSVVSFSAFTGISYRTLKRAYDGNLVRPATVVAIRAELRRARDVSTNAIAAAGQTTAA
ncbi:MAG TPA: hypothetical protein VJY35_10620 [Candidatus Eisenbacteria bacterium]|nr:hypothetical protein [Candidatus Eisenbacteria bacterium]